MIPITDGNFQKIICFYLFECPARSIRTENKKANETKTPDQPHPTKRIYYGRISRMGKTLAERGIEGGALNTLRAAMLRSAGKEFELLTGNDVASSSKKEYISLSRKDFITEGIFAFIRNAFAHGEFNVSNGWYFLENHSNGKLKGKAVLRETTLLNWIEIVDMPLDKIKKIGR
ncbi:hypothetical protein [Butyrivibrio sp. FC2001]|uniref:hypothetical protein n=1 Tax=Butyrivibrio sp. FC2001 TaxID=1280671 RepID=UPI00047AED63|nr:hypothetical protein [Butyrivibrio sp. FC2001]